MNATDERVVIGMDPHKRSVTIEVMAADEEVLGGGRFGTDAAGFSVTLVPHTQGNVVFGAAAPGYVANFEVDVMAKYVERIVGPRLEALERRLAAFERESSGDASR